MLGDTSPYAGQADAIAAQFNIPTEIFRSLIQTESGWNPEAQNPGSSAYGLTQLTSAAQQDVGITDITDPMQQLTGGAAYLSQKYQEFGNWSDALAAYNQGSAGAVGAGSAQGQSYAANILANTSLAGIAKGIYGLAPLGALASGASTLSPVAQAQAFVSSKLGDVGLVVLGIAVVVVALFMSETVRSGVKTVATKT